MFGRDSNDPFDIIKSMGFMGGMTDLGSAFGSMGSKKHVRMNGLEIQGEGFMPITIIDGDESIKIMAFLPGVEKNNIVINAVGNSIELRAKRQPLAVTESENVIYNEMSSEEDAYRMITLQTPVKENESKAKFENGMLTLVLPKSEISIKKGIDIE
ncbi:Hsp20/alpha crystallin family protein [Methanococcus voltae]|uniref:HSP20 family protein n=2 Tax=Methanococcus voltae TaxID=2188 RepID=A0A8J7RPT4_METVO|nr:Hsp20/alpha crystallin family protein [Methanococcus voltae]MBP2173169.1 HSP20 family protein [Methanococcus voltae]MBP2202039.1 HSP20 family protein [Methanococcus voltae]MCS3922872.1 HSP20 family protein [Methanococcus voltae PS]